MRRAGACHDAGDQRTHRLDGSDHRDGRGNRPAKTDNRRRGKAACKEESTHNSPFKKLLAETLVIVLQATFKNTRNSRVFANPLDGPAARLPAREGALIEARGLGVQRGGRWLVRGVDIAIQPGELVHRSE